MNCYSENLAIASILQFKDLERFLMYLDTAVPIVQFEFFFIDDKSFPRIDISSE